MLDYNRLRYKPADEQVINYTREQTILYALGVGVGQTDPTDPGELKFVYEWDLHTLPTMAAVLGSEGRWMADPQWGIDWRHAVLTEHQLTLHQALPAAGTLTTRTTVEEIYDLGRNKGALLSLHRAISSADARLLAETRRLVLLRGNGGFGGATLHATPQPVPAERSPDAALELPSQPQQALLYRLSGDFNPLHVDPKIAARAGFERPILHGLCTYGIAARALLRLCCQNEPSRLKRLHARFVKPVYPGDAILTELWSLGSGTAAFRCRVTHRSALVIDYGFIEYKAWTPHRAFPHPLATA